MALLSHCLPVWLHSSSLDRYGSRCSHCPIYSALVGCAFFLPSCLMRTAPPISSPLRFLLLRWGYRAFFSCFWEPCSVSTLCKRSRPGHLVGHTFQQGC